MEKKKTKLPHPSRVGHPLLNLHPFITSTMIPKMSLSIQALRNTAKKNNDIKSGLNQDCEEKNPCKAFSWLSKHILAFVIFAKQMLQLLHPVGFSKC